MRKICLTMLAVTMSLVRAKAEEVPNIAMQAWTFAKRAGGEVPRECGDPDYPRFGETCNFQCQQGDFIAIYGFSGLLTKPGTCYGGADILVGVSVSASCGGIRVDCDGLDYGYASCQRTSEAAADYDDQSGYCTVVGYCGQFFCRSVTSEEAFDLEKLDPSALLLKVPIN